MKKLKKKYLDILEKHDWAVSSYTGDGRVELEKYSPAGEDFITCLDVENFPEAVAEYAAGFNIDEHIEMWGAAQRLNKRKDEGKHIILLHLGDHDPSGIDMSRDIRDRNVLFENFGMEFHRLALNMDQIDTYSPPPNPTKLTDSRAGGYLELYGHECWELDALEPQVISNLITANVLKYRDDGPYRRVKAQEEQEKELLEDLAEHWGGVAENWDEIKEQYCEEE